MRRFRVGRSGVLARYLAVALAALSVSCFSVSKGYAVDPIPSDLKPAVVVSTATEPVKPGPFAPMWESFDAYRVPEWFRDAKFGIWAHWGPQCQPERGDWYARQMYVQGHGRYRAHLEQYGHPSTFGFKDVIGQWKADRWDPDELVALYKRAGAKYFFAMANHHDNLDLWASKHQPWNSVRVGPKKDILAGWARAARANGLPLGLSVHAAHAWLWYETAQGTDREGPLAGVPYDGTLRGFGPKGSWWEGLDIQDFYEQRHTPSPGFENEHSIHARWNWGGGASQPDLQYCQRFYDRTADLINQLQPELLYFDDTALPLWPVSDAGLKIGAHFYNSGLARSGGKSNGVLFGKILSPDQRRRMTWDVERGAPNDIQPEPWQTDTCIGGWHYDRDQQYKSAATVVHMLADIVSKNGNLLLNVPVRGDGTIDDSARRVVEQIGQWTAANGEAIYATRPFKVFGEGPASAGAKMSAQGFNEGRGKPYTSEDVRFTVSKDGNTVYAIVLGPPAKPGQALTIKSLGTAAGLLDRPISGVSLLSSAEPVDWKQTAGGLVLAGPKAAPSADYCVAYRVTLAVK